MIDVDLKSVPPDHLIVIQCNRELNEDGLQKLGEMFRDLHRRGIILGTGHELVQLPESIDALIQSWIKTAEESSDAMYATALRTAACELARVCGAKKES